MREENNKDIDFEDFLKLLKKHIKIVVFTTLLITVVSWSVSYFLITPIYEASTELLVNKLEGEQLNTYNINDINTDLKLISTYSQIIKSPRIIDLVIAEYKLGIESEELVKKIYIDAVADTQVIKITVKDSDHSKAAGLANAIAKIFQREIITIMNVKNVNILTEAKRLDNPKPIYPNITFNTFIAFIIGLFSSITILYIIAYFKKEKRVIEEVEDYSGYVLLGTIPFKKGSNIQIISEELKILGTNIRISSSNNLNKSIIITSISPDEGKSTILKSLAIILAQKNKKVLLIDTNLRNPVLHKLFGVPNNIGLTNVVVGLDTIRESIQKTGVPNIYILASGILPKNPYKIIESERLESIFKEIYEEYDYILYDTPSIISESDTQKIARYVDGIILVVKSNKKNQEIEAAIKYKSLPVIIKEKLLGIILNIDDEDKGY